MGYLRRGYWKRDETRGWCLYWEGSVCVWNYRTVLMLRFYVGLWPCRGYCQPWIWVGSRKQRGGNGTSPGYAEDDQLLNLQKKLFPDDPAKWNSHKLTVMVVRGGNNRWFPQKERVNQWLCKKFWLNIKPVTMFEIFPIIASSSGGDAWLLSNKHRRLFDKR